MVLVSNFDDLFFGQEVFFLSDDYAGIYSYMGIDKDNPSFVCLQSKRSQRTVKFEVSILYSSDCSLYTCWSSGDLLKLNIYVQLNRIELIAQNSKHEFMEMIRNDVMTTQNETRLSKLVKEWFKIFCTDIDFEISKISQNLKQKEVPRYKARIGTMTPVRDK